MPQVFRVRLVTVVRAGLFRAPVFPAPEAGTFVDADRFTAPAVRVAPVAGAVTVAGRRAGGRRVFAFVLVFVFVVFVVVVGVGVGVGVGVARTPSEEAGAAAGVTVAGVTGRLARISTCTTCGLSPAPSMTMVAA